MAAPLYFVSADVLYTCTIYLHSIVVYKLVISYDRSCFKTFQVENCSVVYDKMFVVS